MPKAVNKGDGYETLSLGLLCVLDPVSVLGVANLGIVSSRASPAEPKYLLKVVGSWALSRACRVEVKTSESHYKTAEPGAVLQPGLNSDDSKLVFWS